MYRTHFILVSGVAIAVPFMNSGTIIISSLRRMLDAGRLLHGCLSVNLVN